MQFLCIFGTKCAQVLTYLWIKDNADSFCERNFLPEEIFKNSVAICFTEKLKQNRGRRKKLLGWDFVRGADGRRILE